MNTKKLGSVLKKNPMTVKAASRIQSNAAKNPEGVVKGGFAARATRVASENVRTGLVKID